ncbi:triosephosphate isomerase (TIM) [Plasmodium inui San Antonio 1]|uniref:Triosephosphate isomerase n=1 Tax=Plasmodium inui San Antonio 1 TaxID=1237626 RepID=W7A2A3_9APIC|nr:triosephosphate isomerase (TIM) [Plasmodium inui San Antonio 1]EUD67352.1 triosephosphate isomerase (TIM) [Plasmodium inui San Antonio 1]
MRKQLLLALCIYWVGKECLCLNDCLWDGSSMDPLRAKEVHSFYLRARPLLKGRKRRTQRTSASRINKLDSQYEYPNKVVEMCPPVDNDVGAKERAVTDSQGNFRTPSQSNSLCGLPPNPRGGQARGKKIIIGNWKCYLTKEEAYTLIDTFTKIKYSSHIDLILSPNLLFIPYLLQKIEENNSKIFACSQDVSLASGFGAFTGETTATLIKQFGNKYTIIGHSERRRGFCSDGETLEETAQKVHNAVQSKLKVILCVGDDYQNENRPFTSSKTRKLLSLIKQAIPKDDMQNIIIALEPSFAVGTGKPGSADFLNTCYWDIKRNIAEEVDTQTRDAVKIVYGGSVTRHNMKYYVEKTPVDGFLIGKGSLDETFIDIIKYVDQSCVSSA